MVYDSGRRTDSGSRSNACHRRHYGIFHVSKNPAIPAITRPQTQRINRPTVFLLLSLGAIKEFDIVVAAVEAPNSRLGGSKSQKSQKVWYLHAVSQEGAFKRAFHWVVHHRRERRGCPRSRRVINITWFDRRGTRGPQ